MARIKMSTAAQLAFSRGRNIVTPPARMGGNQQDIAARKEAARQLRIRRNVFRAVGSIDAGNYPQRFFVPKRETFARGNAPISRRAGRIRLTRRLNAERRGYGLPSIGTLSGQSG